ncbi:Unknown protein [Striga hermonthica]|uniref:Uncharacterized protein n=1 Tax=Striga hermonthica TaxID=68872 RepID=A0A9N7MSM7_STRHE|nr:Unknown protein [Striga hermonthica]
MRSTSDPPGQTKGDGGTCKLNESKVSIRDDQANKKDGKRKADYVVRDVTRSKRANMIASTSNQHDSSDEFVDERPRTRVKPTINHKSKCKDSVDHGHTVVQEPDNKLVVYESDSDDVVFPVVNTRSSASMFVKVVFGLSDAHKHAVCEMGFGSLLDLKITSLPLKMGFWLVENFNYMDRKLRLYDGEKIHVREEDVDSVLGLPRGSLQISNKKKRAESAILSQWINLFDVRSLTNITTAKVLEKFHECADGGDWFKRHFIVLMVTCLFDSCQNGMVNSRIVHLLDDVSKLFYVDKVVLSMRSVLRSFPTFKAWSNDLLRDRERAEIESGTFGRGFVDVDACAMEDDCRPYIVETNADGEPTTRCEAENDV